MPERDKFYSNKYMDILEINNCLHLLEPIARRSSACPLDISITVLLNVLLPKCPFHSQCSFASSVALAAALVVHHDDSLLVLLDELALDEEQVRLVFRHDRLHLESRDDNQCDQHDDQDSLH